MLHRLLGRYHIFARLFVLLLLSSAFSVALLLVRVRFEARVEYLFLIWNLFLGWIPFLLALFFLSVHANLTKGWWALATLFVSWLLFFPNALYIITDFMHLRYRLGAPLWFDVMVLFSFSWNGMMLGFVSLFMIHDIFEQRFGRWLSWGLTTTMIMASSFGVYLGRFLRWNTWDVVNNPTLLAQDVMSRFVDPTDHKLTYAFTLIYGAFFLFAYMQLRLLFTYGDHSGIPVKGRKQ
jgi:uncharacterized membrane protein